MLRLNQVISIRAIPIRAILLSALMAALVLDAAPAATVESTTRVFDDALRQSIGAPARADIGTQATVRLAGELVMVPPDPGAKLLAVYDKPVPPGFAGLLLGSEGVDSLGEIRFVPAGYIDADAALAWTADDILASLKDTVERANAGRVKQGLQEREARRWIQPPRYDPENHRIEWAALIVLKSAPRESDGEITWQAISFGREGYVQLSIATSVQKAELVGRMAEDFMGGVAFRPGKAYADALPTDPRAPNGLAGAMGIDALHKAPSGANFWNSDSVIPVAGGIVGGIGALSLVIYIQRHLRREARRS